MCGHVSIVANALLKRSELNPEFNIYIHLHLGSFNTGERFIITVK